MAFEDMEVMDFAGPFEVFSVANELREYSLFEIKVIGCPGLKVQCHGGLNILCDEILSDNLSSDILVIPGGNGTRGIMNNEDLLNYIDSLKQMNRTIISVCSGALILAKAGVLDGLNATTHHQVLDELKSVSHKINIKNDERFCDNGNIILSAGISAGIDACLHFIKREFGFELETEVKQYMEY